MVPAGIVASVAGAPVTPGKSAVGGGVALGKAMTGGVVASVVVGSVPSLTGDTDDDGIDTIGAEVSTFVGENVGLSVAGFVLGDCVGLGLTGLPDGNAAKEGVTVGENVGPSVDGMVDGSDFREEVGKMDGTIVGS